MIGNNTTLRESKPSFTRHNKQQEFVTVSHVNNETQIFDIVNLVVPVFNVWQIQTVKKDGRVSFLQKATLKHATDYIPLTFFGSMVDVIEEKSTYMLTDLRLSKYKFTKLLNTTESTKITPAGDELSLDAENFKDSNHEIIKGTINSIELHSLVEKYLCQKCKAKVDVDDEIVICLYCNTMTKIDGTIKSGNISFTVTGICCKVHLHVTPEILLEQFKAPITEKFKLVKSMLKSNILVVYCVTHNQVIKLEKID